jgi:hypothetical protein
MSSPEGRYRYDLPTKLTIFSFRLPDNNRPTVDLFCTGAVGQNFRHYQEAIRQALQEFVVKGRGRGRERIMAPSARFPYGHQIRIAEMGEVARHPRLRNEEDIHDDSHAELTICNTWRVGTRGRSKCIATGANEISGRTASNYSNFELATENIL